METDAKLVLYTTAFCPFCHAAKRLLDARAVPYEEVDVGSDPGLRQEVRARYNWPTVPVVVASGEVIGGFTELEALDQTKGLDHLR